MPIKDFKEIFVWKKSHELTLLVYQLTKKYPKDELFALVNQTRRAVVSIPSNIVEGFKRKGKQDDWHFCNIAQASLEEVRYQLLLARDLGYISEDDFNKADQLALEVGKLMHLWMNSKNKK